MNKLDSFPTREHATYWPCENTIFSRSNPQIDIVWPCDLLIVMANAKRIGNCRRLNGMGESEGIIGIRGRRTTSPSNLPFKIIASRTLPIIFFMTNLVPLHSLGAFKFRSKMIGEPIFNRKLCSGIPGKSSEFKNSTG